MGDFLYLYSMKELIKKISLKERKFRTKDELRDIAKKYNRKKEFFNLDGGAYQASKRIGDDFFYDITSHMEDGRSFQEVKWTDEMLRDVTSKYNKLSAFTKENPLAYQVLFRRGKKKYDELTSHMEKRNPNFTDDELRNIASKYKHPLEFNKNDGSAQHAARKRGKEFYDDITKHFIRLQREPYTFDEVMNIALKYDHPGDFQNNENSVYTVARNRGWFDEVTKHMTNKNTSWTLEQVRQLAQKYTTKKEFKDGDPKAYFWSITTLTPEEYKEITVHMEPLGNFANRMIYVFEFPNKSVYVGLTFNSKKRFNQHMRSTDSTVNKYIQKTGLEPIFKETTEYMSRENAIKKEEEIEEQYRKNGWKILNIAKTGALGGSIIKWTFDEVQKEALKYNKLTDFQRKSSGANLAALRNGWVNDVTKHMKKNNRYTLKQLQDIASKYTSLKDFREKDNGAFQSAISKGLFNELTSHMSKGKPKDYVYPPQKKITCPHCGKTGGSTNMNRFHFDNCRYK